MQNGGLQDSIKGRALKDRKSRLLNRRRQSGLSAVKGPGYGAMDAISKHLGRRESEPGLRLWKPRKPAYS